MTAPTLTPHAYVLAVHDLAGTTAYFEKALGFSREWNDGDNWQGLVRDGVRLMLGRCPDALAPAATGDHSYFGFFATDDVDRLHEEIADRGATSSRHLPTSHGVGGRWRWQLPRVIA